MKSASLQYANAMADVALVQGAAERLPSSCTNLARPMSNPPNCARFWRARQ